MPTKDAYRAQQQQASRKKALDNEALMRSRKETAAILRQANAAQGRTGFQLPPYQRGRKARQSFNNTSPNNSAGVKAIAVLLSLFGICTDQPAANHEALW